MVRCVGSHDAWSDQILESSNKQVFLGSKKQQTSLKVEVKTQQKGLEFQAFPVKREFAICH